MLNREAGTSVCDKPVFGNIIKVGDYWYTYLGVVSNDGVGNLGYPGTLVRSQNLVNWEQVSIPSYNVGNYIFECSIAHINDCIILYYRNSGKTICGFNLTNNTWFGFTSTLSGRSEGGRNAVFIYNGYIYAFSNCHPRVSTSGNPIVRSSMAVIKYQLSQDKTSLIEISRTERVKRVQGLVYPVVLNIAQGIFMVCAENWRWPYRVDIEPDTDGATYPSSDIGLVPINFLDDI